MTAAAWFCAGFGAACAVVLLLAIVVDVHWVRADVPTVSERVLTASLYRPWVAALVTGPVCLVLGMLLGHLLFPQRPPV